MPIIRHGYATHTRKGSTRAWRKARLEASNTHCPLCGHPILEADPVDVDHKIPYAYGGTDHPSNLRRTHMACNRARGTG